MARAPTHHLTEGLLFLLTNFYTVICKMGTKLLLSRKWVEEQMNEVRRQTALSEAGWWCLWVGWSPFFSVGERAVAWKAQNRDTLETPDHLCRSPLCSFREDSLGSDQGFLVREPRANLESGRPWGLEV